MTDNAVPGEVPVPTSEGRVPDRLTLAGLVEHAAGRRPDAAALMAPGRGPLSYAGLRDQVEQTAQTLNALGIGRGDRVAVVLPNGPEMASAFLGIAAAAVCAPLNPGYRLPEFDFYLSDLSARALVVPEGSDSPAVAAARERGIPILTLAVPPDAPAGVFRLDGKEGPRAGHAGPADPGDVALVLHTSGTTSRPKRVPLTHRNLCVSAESIRESIRLTEADRCLNIMPLFHIHGLVGALLSSIAAGASVVCTPGFQAPRFLKWAADLQPTWYTAVPTMHQSILQRVEMERAGGPSSAPCRLGGAGGPSSTPPSLGGAGGASFRFIRSCSSPLPPQVMADLERVFGVPVVEAYGMTEAAHQMASNPLPPGARKPGSVGIAAGVDLAILDEAGAPLPPGRRGEVAIRGANVTAGYEGNPEANRAAFTDGWFRTGDEGMLDDDGYLFLTGRLKEIINRAGEKVAPREVDEVLLAHPAVAQAVAFAMPDPRLGEDVAAAVVLHEGAAAGERELQEFSARRLADFKVPRRILILPELPKGPTGKLQRIGLAERLGLAPGSGATPTAPDGAVGSAGAPAEPAAPDTPTEALVERIWSGVLGVQRVGTDQGFLELGGDSLLATRVLARIRQALRVDVPLTAFFGAPTIRSLAGIVDAALAGDDAELPAGTGSEPAEEGGEAQSRRA